MSQAARRAGLVAIAVLVAAGLAAPRPAAAQARGDWAAWAPLGGISTAAPAVTSWGSGRLDVFARGADRALWHRYHDRRGWSAWHSLGGVLASAPAAVATGGRRLHVVVQGTDGALYVTTDNGDGDDRLLRVTPAG